MKTETKVFGLVAGAFAAIVAALLLCWVFSLESMRGLAEWGYARYFVIIGIVGILPLVIALAGLPWYRREGFLPGTILGVAAIALSGIVIVGSIIGAGEIALRSRVLTKPLPPLDLVEPAAGILARDFAASGAAGPVPGPMLRLSISSDPHWGKEGANAAARSAILKSVASSAPARDAFFILGDNVETGMLEPAWRAEALELAAALPETPIRPILGNHDGIVNGQFHFRKYFFPDKFRSDSGSPYYYSIEAGPAKIIVLDLLWGAESFTGKQRAWLEKTLAATPPEKPVLVLSHCFFASSGYIDGDTGKPWYDHYGTLGKVAPILEKYKVDLVVQGHNHYMELLERNGIAYATIGAMGGKPDPVPSHVSPWSQWFAREVYGYLDLDVTAKGFSLAFRDENGKTLKEAFVPAAR